ncbi:hypothetical protein BDR26DRAFT_862466 [Obelidium mucronatum]|nr:hypothetical protein BDR26DRAFT_862466 [Obelidium mucronatum]
MKNRTPLPDSIFEIQRGAIMIQRNEKYNSIDRIHDIERNTLARRSIIHAEIGGGGYDLKADLDVVVVAESAEASAGKDRFCAACVEPIEIARTRSDKPPLAELKRYESRLVRAYSLDANALEKRRRDMMARQQSKRNVQNAAVRCNTTSLSSGILADIESVGMDNALEAGDFSFDVGAGDDSSSVASCEMMVPFQTGWILSEYETQAHIPHSSAVVELE